MPISCHASVSGKEEGNCAKEECCQQGCRKGESERNILCMSYYQYHVCVCVHYHTLTFPTPAFYLYQCKAKWAKMVKGHKLVVNIPNHWWNNCTGSHTEPYVIDCVDIKQDNKKKDWYQRSIFRFKWDEKSCYLNFVGLLGYVDPDTVPGSLSLEEGLPWAKIPVTVSTPCCVKLSSIIVLRSILVSLQLVTIHIPFYIKQEKMSPEASLNCHY